MIKIISFDLDGTLVKNKYADIVWLQGLPEIYSKEKNVSFNEAKKILFKKYDEVSDQRVDWYDIDYWFNRFNLKSSWEDLLSYYSFAIESFDEVENVLEKLSESFKLIISSNAKHEFIDIQIKKLCFNKYFIKKFSSISDFGLVKKHPKFYYKIAKELKVKTNQIVHVGDNYDFDYISAKKAGVNAFYLDKNGLKKGYNFVKNLNEFSEKIL